MIGIRRILCPIDFSDASRHALEHAVAIAKWYESQIVALHVIPVLPPPPTLFAESRADAAPDDTERQALEGQLRAWLEPADRAGLKTDLLIDQGNPVPDILGRASSLPADLIVIGTHGLGGFDRLMLGSVAEKVLRKAACPVMTVPPAAASAARVPYARLLCPVDFSEPSQAALQFAYSVAEESDAHITILHVIDWPADDELLVEGFDVSQFRQRVEETARGRLEALVTEDVRVWCKPETKVDYGKPYRRILEQAEREGSDLIVIGVRGRNPLDLTLLGSTANHVVRRAVCPVLTIRGDAGVR